MIIGAVSHKTADVIEQFKKNKIPVVAINVPIKNKWISTNIATNNNKAAEIAGRFLLSRLKKINSNRKRVVILCGDKVQEDALIRAAVPHDMLSNVGYDVHDYFAKGWSSRFSLTDILAEYSSHKKDIVAVFSCYAGASIASIDTAKAFDWKPIQVGFDMDENMRMMIEAGFLDATVIQNPQQIGIVGIESMFKILKEDILLPKFIEIPAQLVTIDNIKNL